MTTTPAHNPAHPVEPPHSTPRDDSWHEIAIIAAGGLFVAIAWFTHLREGPLWLFWLAAALSIPFTSLRTSRRALQALREKRIDVDILMFVAAAGAAAIGHAVEGAFLLFLFGLGAAGEHLAMERAERSLRHLEALMPETAEKALPDNSFTTVPIESLAQNDLVRVRPFERIPTDGIITQGASALDESTLTGESLPIDKTTDDEVFAGTLNTSGTFIFRVTRPASQSAIARVIHSVTDARSKRATVELLTERIGRIYAPAILAAAALLFAIPTLLGYSAATWFYRSMAFLTAASPCALAIGAPATYLCAIAAAARRGLVFKGGEAMERLASIRAIALDKTGTITQGTPRVHRIIPLQDRTDILPLAAAIEAFASHPIADAIVNHARESSAQLPTITSPRQIAGLGVEATCNNQRITVGSPKLIQSQPQRDLALQHTKQLAQEACSIVVITIDSDIVGLIGVRDQLRDDAREAIAALASKGLRITMLTGDHAGVAASIAHEVGITEVHAELSPGSKMAHLEAIERDTGHVAMVGDGANDAPALARATVSLSIGAASDVAAENADIAIMGERLMSVVEAHTLSRRAARVMRQNLFFALAIIATVAPLAAAGYANLGLAVILHEGSTVLVVLNALRLLRFKST